MPNSAVNAPSSVTAFLPDALCCFSPIHVLTLDPSELEMPWCCLFGGTLLVKSKSSGKPNPLNDDSAGGDGAAAGGKVLLQEWMVLDMAKLTRAGGGGVEPLAK